MKLTPLKNTDPNTAPYPGKIPFQAYSNTPRTTFLIL